MTKYSVNFKLKIVKEYLQGGRAADLSKKYQINNSNIFNWIQRYNKFGIEGLKIRNSGYDYDGNFKLTVLKWKEDHQATYSKTALHFDISNPGTIANWQKKYSDFGSRGLFKQPEYVLQNKSELVQLKKLRHENHLLMIENEYLKKVQALIQKDELQTSRLMLSEN